MRASAIRSSRSQHLEKWAAENDAGLAETLQAPELAAMRTNPRVAAAAQASQPDAVTVDGGQLFQ